MSRKSDDLFETHLRMNWGIQDFARDPVRPDYYRNGMVESAHCIWVDSAGPEAVDAYLRRQTLEAPPRSTGTTTYARLRVSRAAYDDILSRLRKAGEYWADVEPGQKDPIQMDGIAIEPED